MNQELIRKDLIWISDPVKEVVETMTLKKACIARCTCAAGGSYHCNDFKAAK